MSQSAISKDNTGQFVYEGHRVKIKVTGAEKIDNHPVFPQAQIRITIHARCKFHRQ